MESMMMRILFQLIQDEIMFHHANYAFNNHAVGVSSGCVQMVQFETIVEIITAQTSSVCTHEIVSKLENDNVSTVGLLFIP